MKPEPTNKPPETPAGELDSAGCAPMPGSAALWLCNRCGHEFEEMDAAGVDVSPECEEQIIACPKCWANNLDEDGSLTHPDDRLPNVQTEGPPTKTSTEENK